MDFITAPFCFLHFKGYGLETCRDREEKSNK